jgi:hypothetical protein
MRRQDLALRLLGEVFGAWALKRLQTSITTAPNAKIMTHPTTNILLSPGRIGKAVR